METSWKSGVVALVTLAAVPWLVLQHGSTLSPDTRNDSGLKCNSQDLLTHCAAEADFGYPIGDGLVITLIEEFF
jgi:hypothetical protein